MTAEERAELKRRVDAAARERAATSYLDLDPESLTARALEADDEGYVEIGDALRRFRDRVVNPLLGEGWTLARIEDVAAVHFGMAAR